MANHKSIAPFTDYRIEEVSADISYRAGHGAADRHTGAPLHDVSLVMADYYIRPQYYYESGGNEDRAVASIIRGCKRKPRQLVTVYRAVPNNVTTINPGEPVTLSKSYAERMAEEGCHIVEKKVPARELFTSGHSHFEWGWDPQEPAAVALQAAASLIWEAAELVDRAQSQLSKRTP